MQNLDALTSQLIEANKLFEEATVLTDSVALGREPTEQEEEAYAKAVEARDNARNNFLDFIPQTLEEAAHKAATLIDHQDVFDLSNEQTIIRFAMALKLEPQSLTMAVNSYNQIKAKLNAQPEDTPEAEREALCRDMLNRAEAIFNYPCHTIVEIKQKARVILADRDLIEFGHTWDSAVSDILNSFLLEA